jgi:uncharacterized protein HemX
MDANVMGTAATAAGGVITNITHWIQLVALVLVLGFAAWAVWMAKCAKDGKKVIDAETELRKARRDQQLGEMQSRFNDELTRVKALVEKNAESISRHIEEDREKDNKTAIYIEKIDTALNILKENFHHVDVKLERIMTAMDIDKRDGKRGNA